MCVRGTQEYPSAYDHLGRDRHRHADPKTIVRHVPDCLPASEERMKFPREDWLRPDQKEELIVQRSMSLEGHTSRC